MLVGGLQVEVLGGVLDRRGVDGEVGGDPRVIEVDVGRPESEKIKTAFETYLNFLNF